MRIKYVLFVHLYFTERKLIMITKINIKPFRKFWADCSLNDVLSIITSKDNSYLPYAYMNGYHYESSGETCWWQSSIMDYNEDYLKEVDDYILFNDINQSITKESMHYELKKLINSKRLIYVTVDVYYWLNNRVDYHVKHYNHYMLLTGYDDEKLVYYFLCDTNQGYDEYEVSFKILEDSVILEDGTLCLKELIINENIPQYSFSLNQSIFFAEQLYLNTSYLTYSKPSKGIAYKDDLTYHIMNITKRQERQKANIELFKYLLKCNYIDNLNSNIMVKKANIVYNDLAFIKNIFIYHYLKKNPNINDDLINKKISIAFQDEALMWEFFLSTVM